MVDRPEQEESRECRVGKEVRAHQGRPDSNSALGPGLWALGLGFGRLGFRPGLLMSVVTTIGGVHDPCHLANEGDEISYSPPGRFLKLVT